MKKVTKEFPGVVANDHVDFNLKKGEIHALLGENGAGKSTLMKILAGIYKLDEGEIIIGGKKVNFNSPADALEKGGIIYIPQIPQLPEGIRVGELLLLSKRKFLITKGAMESLKEIITGFGMEIDVSKKTEELSMGEKQKVEILRGLLSEAKILILDEPTTVLVPKEIKELLLLLKRLREEGVSIVFITHKVEEALRVADRITVLRKGKKIATVRPKEITKEKLIRLMVGEVSLKLTVQKRPKGRVLLRLKEVTIGEGKRELVKRVSFEVREGEIFGIAGIAGNGQRELAEAIVGLRKISAGNIKVLGKIAFIPDERSMAILPEATVAENVILGREDEFTKGFILDRRRIQEFAKSLIENFNITPRDIKCSLFALSGGNVGKLIFAREITKKVQILIICHPTFGLDVITALMVRKEILNLAKEGRAIVLISEDLEEIMELADRIGVISGGRILKILKREEATMEEIGALMGGEKLE